MPDVIVIGAGNSGLCAAIAAAQRGKHVLVLETAPREYRGGNSALTMNFRFPHRSVDELLKFIDPADRSKANDSRLRRLYSPYPITEFLIDLIAAAGGRCDLELARRFANCAFDTACWLRSLGHRWHYKETANAIPRSMPITLQGAGRDLQRRNFNIARRFGVRVSYGTTLTEIVEHGMSGATIRANFGGETRVLGASSVILACGSFEGSATMRAQYLGPKWRDIALRGVPFNTGEGLRAALAVGAAPAGDWASCHATPQNSELPDSMLPSQHRASQSNSRYMFGLGITVNRQGRRFVDEGEDLPNLIYAKMGRHIQLQTASMAFQLFDHAMVGLLPRGYFEGGNLHASSSLHTLAEFYGIEARQLAATVTAFNRSAHANVSYGDKDGAGTQGLNPNKTHWAQRLCHPPYYMVPVRAGLTFTYGGLATDQFGRLRHRDGSTFHSVLACGEMVGGLFTGNYVGGSGLMFGAYTGRLAGRHA